MRKRPASQTAARSLQRTGPRPMALEQRFMFDGAALADAVDVATKPLAATDAGLLHVAAPAGGAPAVLEMARLQAQQQVVEFLSKPDALQQLFTLFNGGQSQPSQAWLAAAQALLQDPGHGAERVDVQLRSQAELHGSLGAFSAAGPDGKPVIFLNADWLQRGADSATVARVLVEEIGHGLDARLNGGADTAGDEGEAFSVAVAGQHLSASEQQRIATENDSATVTLDGVDYAVEDATVTFTQAYTGTPSSLSEEANSLNNVAVLTPFAGTSFQFVSANPSDLYYSGNNVTGYLNYKDSSGVDQSLYGVVSRQFKTNGVTNGFYFYAPGTDGVIGTGDAGEAAYLLVVDPTKFSAGGTYGTSSDPVDTALNNYLNHYTPASAVADTGTAVEKGGLSNASGGSNATGNVLSNDAGSASPSVNGAGTNTAGTAVTTTLAGGGTAITGVYGTLTIGTDGNYSYAVNDSNATVQALRGTSNTLTDTFTYRITDTHSPATLSTAQLKITIQGANDTPVATADVGNAKVSLLTDGTAYSGTDTIGSKSTGNVLYNDSDVDKYGETKTVAGLTASGAYASYTAGGTATSLTFSGSNGSFYKSVNVGDHLYTSKISNNYYLLKTAGNANIQVTSKAANADGTYSIGLSGTIDHYSASTAFTITGGTTKVDFYPDATRDNTNNLPSGKEATVNTASAVQYSTVTLSGITGNVVVGMTATGTNIPSGAKVTAVSGNTVTLDKLLSSSPSGTLSFLAAGGTTVNGALGTLVLNADGSYVYTPLADAAGGTSGTEVFTYTMQDAGGLLSTSTLTVNVQASSASDPNAKDDAVTGTEQGTSAGTHPAGNVVTGTITSGSGTGTADSAGSGATFGANPVTGGRLASAASSTAITSGSYVDFVGLYGTLRLNSTGAYTYTIDNSNTQVNALNSGDTLSEVFYYTTTNSLSRTDTAALTVTISGANDAPVAVNDTLSAVEDTPVTFAAADLLGNDSDVDSTTLTIGSVTSGTGGTVVKNGDGTVTFTPTANFNGNASFTYTVSDGVTTSTATVTVVVAAVNDYPVARDNTYTTPVNTLLGGRNVITNTDATAGTDSDVETTTASLTIARVNGVTFSANGVDAGHLAANGWMQVSLSHGTLFIQADGSTEYNPANGDATGDSFTYTVSDGSGESDPATVTLSVAAVATPTVSVSNVTVSEASLYAVFQVSLDFAGAGAISFTPTLTSGTATVGTDTGASSALQYFNGTTWVSAAGGITLAAGTTSVLVRTAITNDTTFEGAESFTLGTGAITGTVTNAAGTNGTGTVLDDGSSTNVFLAGNNTAAPTAGTADNDTPTVSVNNITVSEASPYAVFQVSLDRASTGTIAFTPSLTSASATVGTDTGASAALEYFNGTAWVSASGGITLAAGATSVLVRTAITGDNTFEGAETFTLDTGSITGTVTNTSGASGTGTIQDDGASTDVFLAVNNTATPTAGTADNDTPSVSIAVSPANMNEDAAGVLTYTVTLSNPSAFATTVDYSLTGTATAGVDYSTTGTGTLTIAAGATTGTFTVDPAADATVEANETVIATLTSATTHGVTLSLGSAATGTLLNDDVAPAPTLIVSSDKSTLKAGESATITFTLSETASDFTAADVSVTGGTLSGFTGSGTSYSATFTPTAGSTGTATVHVGDSAFTGVGGANDDGADGDNTATLSVDTVRPSVIVSTSSSSLKLGETATLTFTLSEASTDFTAADVSVTGGTLSNFSGSGTTYTATYTPSGTGGTVSVASSAFSDAAGNFNADGADADNSVAIAYDGVRPTVVVTADNTSLKLGETATVTFTLSEAATDFTAADVTVTGGTLSNFSGSGTTYTATFTPSGTGGTVSVASSTFSDAAGNFNADGADADNSVAIAYDGVRPTVIVSTSSSSLKLGETATITFTLSEASTDFTAGDVTVTGGSLTNFSGSGTTYTATFTPSGTGGTVSVASSTFSDAAGNFNADGADADNSVAIAYDGVRPTVIVSTSSSSLKLGETATITFTLSEASTDFTSGDVTVTGGSLTNFSGSGTTYTATYTPSGTGGTVSVASSTFSDAAGNFNADGADADNSVAIAYDGVRPTVAVSTSSSGLKLGETATITFTLSEASTDFTAGDVTVTGGSLTNFSGSGTTYTATYTPSGTGGTVSVASSTFSDAAGNFNADGADADNSVAIAYDGVRPTVIVSTSSSSLKLGETATLTFTLSEASTDFTAADVAVTGGSLTNFSGSGTTYTATFTPSGSGGTVSVASSTFSDAAGNFNADGADANNAVAIAYDGVRPTVAVTADNTSLRLGDTATITFTLSEASVDFTAADVTVTGGTLSGFSGSGTTYTATYTPSGSGGTVSVGNSAFSDAAGNFNADGADANNSVSISYGGVRPAVVVSTSSSSLKLGETATITITLSEASTDFTAGDVSVTGGTLSNFSGSGTTYTATFTPSGTGGTVSVASSTFSDAAGNFNADGTDADNAVAIAYDGVRPSVVVSTSSSGLKLGETATITFTLSEASTDFTAADVTVTGGALSNFSGSGTTYTATFTPSGNGGTVSVGNTAFSDAAGNFNADGADANNSVAIAYDGARPTVVVSTNSSSLKLGETATITFTLSEASTDFTAGDVSVTGGTLSNFSGSGTTYTATFTPSGTGGTVSVASSTFSDAAGNFNADGADADNSVAIAYDGVRPTVVVSTSSSSLKLGESATLTFTLSEASVDFTAADVAVTGGSLTNFSGSGTTYTATFTPSGTGGTVSVASSTFSDAAGNFNADGADANNAVVIAYDGVRPTVVVSTSSSSLKLGETATLTFTLSEASVDFTAADVTVTGGTLSGFNGSGTTYTATYTPSGSGGTVSVDSSTFSDAAGNFNADGADANNAVAIAYDGVRPSVLVSTSSSSLKLGETATVTFTLSEASADFTAADVTVTGGTLSNFSGSGTTYTATYTPSGTGGTVSVGNTAFSDAAGNFNADGADADNSVAIAYDGVRPTVVVSTSSSSLKLGETATVTFTLSESSADFTAADVTVTGGILSNFSGSGSGTTYTATYTPSGAGGTVSVDSSTFSDAAGNFNADGADANNAVAIAYDGVRPTVVVSTSSSSLKLGETATLTFTLSEASTDFTAADVTVTGGTLSNFSGSGITYTATYTPGSSTLGTGSVSVDSGRFSDAAGNVNADGADADNHVALSIDTLSTPTVSSPTVNEGSPFAVFTVSGTAGQSVALTLAGGSATGGGTDFGNGAASNLQVSVDGGLTWTDYSGTLVLPSTGSLLARTPVVDDPISDNGETFTLTATAPTGTATGTATLKDDGTGSVFRPDGTVDATAPRTDDRTVSVTSLIVNEASPTAVFAVSGTAGQTLNLALTGGTATDGGTDFGPGLQVSVDDGVTWTAYAGSVTLPASGALLVRTPIVNDSIADNNETFSLTATPVGGRTAMGTATIRDDGTGTLFKPDGSVDTATPPDDDRPKPVQPPVPPPAPAPVEPLAPAMPVSLPVPPAAVPTTFAVVERVAAEPAVALPARLGDALTESSGFRVVVVESSQPNLTVFMGITDQYVEKGHAGSFTLPADAFAHTRPEASINLTAKRADGANLPPWVRFDARSGTFQVDPPAGFDGELQVVVIARDAEGREARTMFKMSVGKGKKVSLGRPGFSEQMRTAAHPGAAWLGERGAKVPA